MKENGTFQNNSGRKLLALEFLLLFIILPISLALPYPLWLKAGMVILGFVYVLYVLVRKCGVRFRLKRNMDWPQFWKQTLLRFLIIAAITSVFVYFSDSAKLFFVPRTNFGLYILILFVYTFLSVWPQEIIYRTFFFERYGSLFRYKNLLIFINAIVFSLAHLFFRNTLVLILTFLGGLLFAHTFYRFRSTALVSIEHAVYGNWLFTIGMGQMLAFPGMES